MAKDRELQDHERAHTGKPGAKVRHGQDAVGSVNRIVIHRHPDFGEYRVKNKGGAGHYFTDDKQDAIDTAKTMHGEGTNITFRSKRYDPDPD